jgi:hypothetical protein
MAPESVKTFFPTTCDARTTDRLIVLPQVKRMHEKFTLQNRERKWLSAAVVRIGLAEIPRTNILALQ